MAPVPSLPPAAVPTALEVRDALREPRVQRALALALRDRWMRAGFGRLRAAGASVSAAVSALTGPYADLEGRPYYLSEERVRAIVYRKGNA